MIDRPTGPVTLILRALPKPLPGRIFVALIVVALILLIATGCGRVREADSEYEQALSQIDDIQEYLGDRDLYELTAEDMAWLESEFVTLAARIDNIKRLSTLPLGLDSLLGDAERGSSRYRAIMETLEVARLMARSGQVIASIGQEALTALDETGIRENPDINGETWLDVLQRRESDLIDAFEIMHEALALRAEIEEDQLPDRVRRNLLQIDSMTDRFATQLELVEHLPVAFVAFGADEPVRYLVIFQNPAELRPTGGFVGTLALVEIERGQLVTYEFQDVGELSQAYRRNVEDPIDPPWGIAEYVRPDFLQYQDANWWADFPITARVLMNMTHTAGWPDVDGVVAVQPDAVASLISVTGPIAVEVDGEDRLITQTNLHEEAERQRRLARDGVQAETGHKEVIALIGEALLDQLEDLDRESMIESALLMFNALDRRDIQAFHSDNQVQVFLESRNWAGLLQPHPDTPTVATVFANITGLKTSLVMQPSFHLELFGLDSQGLIEAALTISLEHLGEREGDPFYEGFQRWWLDVVLPDGASLTGASPSSAPDPDASSGGAYVIDLDVGETQVIVVRFIMPQPERIVVRRQPGLVEMRGTIERDGCDDGVEFSVSHDVAVSFDEWCPAIEVEDDHSAWPENQNEGAGQEH